MHDFFVSVPIELEESAQLDGASRLTVFYEIVLPLARAGLAATTLLVLILSWNEYVLALFLSTIKAQTMPILVAAMNGGEKGILWWSMCVVILIMIIPVIFMALMLQRFISKDGESDTNRLVTGTAPRSISERRVLIADRGKNFKFI